MASYGTLYLIPTPLSEDHQISPESKKLLENALSKSNSIILVEELKPARKRWILWGLDRSGIERFISYSEHNQKDDAIDIITSLQKGRDVYLMSDGGLPAFCDPGQMLVNLCHQKKIKVTSGSFCNSPMLALSLSGFQTQPFYFVGFLPTKEGRKEKISKLSSIKETFILMDTPYRLGRLLSELSENSALKNRQAYLAMDLNFSTEYCLRDTIFNLTKTNWGKREFILVVNALK